MDTVGASPESMAVCAESLGADLGQVQAVFGLALDICNKIRAAPDAPFYKLAQDISRSHGVVLLLEDSSQGGFGIVTQEADGTPVIRVGGTVGLMQNVMFYRELAFAVRHLKGAENDGRSEAARRQADAESWLIALMCAHNDGRVDHKGLRVRLDDIATRLPNPHGATLRTVLDYFNSNWVDLAVPAASVERIGPELVLALDRRLVERIARDGESIFRLDSRAFEVLVAQLLDGLGYEVELTQPTKDGGADIIAIRTVDDLALRFLVECKRYSEHRKVGVSFVRSLFGVKNHIGASKAILATTSSFSGPAVQFAEAHRWELELKDLNGVLGWVHMYLKGTAQEP